MMGRFTSSSALRTTLATLAIMSLAGCHDKAPVSSMKFTDASGKTIEQILTENKNTKGKEKLTEGLEAMLAGDLEKASASFNAALVDDPTNSQLHTLNGMVYQIKAQSGDMMMLDLAQAGFDQALKFDPSNAQASIGLGRVLKAKKKYREAQEEFANALLLKPHATDALFELASTAYLQGDLKTARAAVERYIKAHPDKPGAQRAAALILAAAGKSREALEAFGRYQELEKNPNRIHYVKGRLEDFKRLHQQGMIMLAEANPAVPAIQQAATDPGASGSVDPTAQQAATDPSAAEAVDPNAIPGIQSEVNPAALPAALPAAKSEMVVVDSVIMRVSERGITSKGQNILENFSVTLAPGTHWRARGGRTDQSSASFGISSASIFPGAASTAGLGATTTFNPESGISLSRLFTQGVSFGTINYSLNIANAKRENIEVLDRPSVTSTIGQSAKFFSGTNIAITTAGQFGGNVSQTPSGITLEVTPLSKNGDEVTLQINIKGSLIDRSDLENIQAGSGTAQNKYLRIAESSVMTTVTMKLGETLMLGGIQTRVDNNSKSGVPFLQDLPVIQYLFSKETTDSERKSVTFLITPRDFEENQKTTRTAFKDKVNESPNLTELEMRNKDWFTPYSTNQVIILKQQAPLYREFRTGDVEDNRWYQREELEGQLIQMASFLYY